MQDVKNYNVLFVHFLFYIITIKNKLKQNIIDDCYQIIYFMLSYVKIESRWIWQTIRLIDCICFLKFLIINPHLRNNATRHVSHINYLRLTIKITNNINSLIIITHGICLVISIEYLLRQYLKANTFRIFHI